MAKQTIKQRKAIRSAAAKKGWETRRERRVREATTMRERREQYIREMNERMQNVYWARVEQPPASDAIPDILRGTPPKPSLWQRIKRWWA